MAEYSAAGDTLSDSLSLKLVHELPVKPSVDTTIDFQSIDFPRPIPLSSFFKSQLLVPKNNQPVLHRKFQPDWILFVFLFGFILLAWLNMFHFQRFRQVLASPFSRRFMNQLQREGDLFSERIALVLAITYLLMFPLLIYELIFSFGKIELPLDGFKLYLAIVACVGGYWLLKIIVIKFLGSVFKTSQTTSAYLLNSLVINFLGALALLPVLIFMVYLKSQIMLDIALVIFGLFFLFRFIRGFLVGISLTRFSYLYLFVYLCTLEILPLVVLAKIFISQYF